MLSLSQSKFWFSCLNLMLVVILFTFIHFLSKNTIYYVLWCAWDLAFSTIIYSIILQRLLQKIMEDQSYAEETASYGHNADIVQAMKVIVLLIYCMICCTLDFESCFFWVTVFSLVWRAYDWSQIFDCYLVPIRYGCVKFLKFRIQYGLDTNKIRCM